MWKSSAVVDQTVRENSEVKFSTADRSNPYGNF